MRYQFTLLDGTTQTFTLDSKQRTAYGVSAEGILSTDEIVRLLEIDNDPFDSATVILLGE